MFIVGDKVRCVNESGYSQISEGKLYRVIFSENPFICIINDEGEECMYASCLFEIETEKENALQTEKQQHKHRELIIAWANGAAIECRNDVVDWFETENPSWCLDTEYRVKPETKPDQSRTMFVELHPRLDNAYNKPNLKLTFDGETGKLKATEIIDND